MKAARVTLEKLYRVVLVTETNYSVVFNGSQEECKTFKKENRKMGKLAIQYYENNFVKA